MPDLAVLYVFAAASAGALLILRWRRAARQSEHRRTFELRFPRGFNPADAAQVVRALSGLPAPWWGRLLGAPAVVFEVRADATGIRHVVRVPEAFATFFTAQLAGAGVRFSECSDDPPPAVSTGAEFGRPSLLVPLNTDDPEAVATGRLAALGQLASGEVAVMQTVVRPATPPRPAALDPARSWWRQALGFVSATTPSANSAVRDWQREPALAVAVRIGVAAETAGAERHLLGRLHGSLQLTQSREAALRRRFVPGGLVAGRITRGAAPGPFPVLLRAAELAVVLALPMGETPAPGVRLAGARQLPPAASLPRTGRVLGEATFPGAERPIALGRPEAATRHMWAIGPSGTGKSTELLRAALDDAAAGVGLCLIDPKGDLVSDFIDRLSPNRANDLILLDAADIARPVGFNPLTGSSPELAADGVLHIFRHLARTRWGGSWGPRLEDVLRNSLITLARAKLTLCELPALLLDASVRRAILADLPADPLGVGPFWHWYAGLSDGEREQVAAPVVNKVRGFIVLPQVRNIIGQRHSAFSLPDVLAQGKILCVSLPRGVIGEDAATLIAASVISSIWRAVLGRSALPPAARRPFFITVDEWQDVTALPTSFGEALAASRGMNIGWTLANQHAAQLPADLRAAALANAQTKVCFRLGAQDAALFAKEFTPYVTASDLTALEPFEAVAVVAGSTPPVSIRTLPAPPPTGDGQAIRAASQKRYGRDRAEVEADLRDRLDGGGRPVTVGTRRRP